MKQINSVNLTAPTLGAVTSFYQSVQTLIAAATVLHIEAQEPPLPLAPRKRSREHR